MLFYYHDDKAEELLCCGTVATGMTVMSPWQFTDNVQLFYINGQWQFLTYNIDTLR